MQQCVHIDIICRFKLLIPYSNYKHLISLFSTQASTVLTPFYPLCTWYKQCVHTHIIYIFTAHEGVCVCVCEAWADRSLGCGTCATSHYFAVFKDWQMLPHPHPHHCGMLLLLLLLLLHFLLPFFSHFTPFTPVSFTHLAGKHYRLRAQ